MLINASDAAVGDFSPEFGHIQMIEQKPKNQFKITFVNGKTMFVKGIEEIDLIQGGWKETDQTAVKAPNTGAGDLNVNPR